MNNTLTIWTFYENPADFPRKYVIRRWLIRAGEARATKEPSLVCDIKPDNYMGIMKWMDDLGLMFMMRMERDDYTIMGTWI